MYANMGITDEVRAQIETIDRQILDLLEQRMRLCRYMNENEEGGEDPADVLSWWLEEGAERGLDELGVEKACRSTLLLCRKTGE